MLLQIIIYFITCYITIGYLKNDKMSQCDKLLWKLQIVISGSISSINKLGASIKLSNYYYSSISILKIKTYIKFQNFFKIFCPKLNFLSYNSIEGSEESSILFFIFIYLRNNSIILIFSFYYRPFY